MEIKGVIFDLDGVIVDTAEYHFMAWKNLSENLGIFIDRDFNEKLKGVSRIESLEKILEIKGLENKYTIEEKVELANKKNEEYKSLIKNITPSSILPGIKDFLEELKSRKIKIALASVSHNANMVLEGLNAKKYFDYIADPQKCERGKPAPDIFLQAAKGILLDPKECIGIEDAAAGIEAINLANMFSVGIGSRETLKGADIILESTKKLNIKLIEYISQGEKNEDN